MNGCINLSINLNNSNTVLLLTTTSCCDRTSNWLEDNDGGDIKLCDRNGWIQKNESMLCILLHVLMKSDLSDFMLRNHLVYFDENNAGINLVLFIIFGLLDLFFFVVVVVVCQAIC